MSVCVQLWPIQWCSLRWRLCIRTLAVWVLIDPIHCHLHQPWQYTVTVPGIVSWTPLSSLVSVVSIERVQRWLCTQAFCVVEKRHSLLCYQVKFLQGMRLDHDQRDHYQETTLPTGEYRQWHERWVCQPACFGRHCAISKVTQTDRFPEGAFSCSGDWQVHLD